MIETKFVVMPSPFDEYVIDLYKKLDDAVTLSQKVKLDRLELLVLRDALRFAVPMPLVDCKDIDEDSNVETFKFEEEEKR